MHLHTTGKLGRAFWSGCELIGQPQLGRSVNGS